MLAIFDILTTRISIRSKKKKKSILEWIGVGHILFIFLLQIIISITIPQTNAYAAVKDFLNKNNETTEEFGQINGISYIPIGSFSWSQTSEGVRGDCYYLLIVKGSKKYKRMNFIIQKDFNTDWIVKIDK